MVWRLATWRNADAERRGETPPIPENSITKPPSAELRPGQLDTDSLPDYDELDPFLADYIDGDLGREATARGGPRPGTGRAGDADGGPRRVQAPPVGARPEDLNQGVRPGPAAADHQPVQGMTAAEDPYLWLEDIEDERALSWVRERNAETTASLATGDRFEMLRTEIREVLDSAERIPSLHWRGEHLYNFWKDEANPRGLWRRTTVDGVRADEWQVLLDLDALAPPRARTGCGPARRSCARTTGDIWCRCRAAAPTRAWSVSSTWRRASCPAASNCRRRSHGSVGSTSTRSSCPPTSALAR